VASRHLLSEETVDALLEVAGPGAQTPLFMVGLRQLGGALAQQPQSANADPDWDWHSAAEDTPEQLTTLWRHVGHADLIRESVDGLTGEDPQD
jgi:hypothetical protein